MKTFLVIVVAIAAFLNTHAAEARSGSKQHITAPNVSVDEAEKMLQQTNVVVLDVRTPKEFKQSRIRGATNVNFYDRSFRDQLQALDKSRPYLVHCAVGGRSAKAVKMMQELGFTNVFHLESGMTGWEKARKPVER